MASPGVGWGESGRRRLGASDRAQSTVHTSMLDQQGRPVIHGPAAHFTVHSRTSAPHSGWAAFPAGGDFPNGLCPLPSRRPASEPTASSLPSLPTSPAVPAACTDTPVTGNQHRAPQGSDIRDSGPGPRAPGPGFESSFPSPANLITLTDNVQNASPLPLPSPTPQKHPSVPPQI